jgi:hypothetical protein
MDARVKPAHDGSRTRKAGKSLASRIFPLTRVTRIFQKNVFTKNVPAGPAGAVAGFFVAHASAGDAAVALGLEETTWVSDPRGTSVGRSCAARP